MYLHIDNFACIFQANNWNQQSGDASQRSPWILQPSNTKSFRCETCGKIYSNSHGLWRHKQVEHLKCAMVPCTECGKNFTRKDHMLRHLRIEHLKLGSINCPRCNKVFFRKDKLNLHLGRCHGGQAGGAGVGGGTSSGGSGGRSGTANAASTNNNQQPVQNNANNNNQPPPQQNTQLAPCTVVSQHSSNLMPPPFYQNLDYLNMISGYSDDTARSFLNSAAAASSTSRPVFPMTSSYYGDHLALNNSTVCGSDEPHHSKGTSRGSNSDKSKGGSSKQDGYSSSSRNNCGSLKSSGGSQQQQSQMSSSGANSCSQDVVTCQSNTPDHMHGNTLYLEEINHIEV